MKTLIEDKRIEIQAEEMQAKIDAEIAEKALTIEKCHWKNIKASFDIPSNITLDEPIPCLKCDGYNDKCKFYIEENFGK